MNLQKVEKKWDEKANPQICLAISLSRVITYTDHLSSGMVKKKKSTSQDQLIKPIKVDFPPPYKKPCQ